MLICAFVSGGSRGSLPFPVYVLLIFRPLFYPILSSLSCLWFCSFEQTPLHTLLHIFAFLRFHTHILPFLPFAFYLRARAHTHTAGRKEGQDVLRFLRLRFAFAPRRAHAIPHHPMPCLPTCVLSEQHLLIFLPCVWDGYHSARSVDMTWTCLVDPGACSGNGVYSSSRPGCICVCMYVKNEKHDKQQKRFSVISFVFGCLMYACSTLVTKINVVSGMA